MKYPGDEVAKTLLFYYLIFSVSGGYSIAAYVLLTELVGIRHRSTAGCSIWYSFNLSSMSLAGLAYLVRDWRKLSIIMGAPAIPFVLGWL